jgi:hypothetical protein
LLVGLAFGAVTLTSRHFGISLLYISAIAAIFAMLGIIVALWAESFEQLQVLNTFVITPMTYLGGIFLLHHHAAATRSDHHLSGTRSSTLLTASAGA